MPGQQRLKKISKTSAIQDVAEVEREDEQDSDFGANYSNQNVNDAADMESINKDQDLIDLHDEEGDRDDEDGDG